MPVHLVFWFSAKKLEHVDCAYVIDLNYRQGAQHDCDYM